MDVCGRGQGAGREQVRRHWRHASGTFVVGSGTYWVQADGTRSVVEVHAPAGLHFAPSFELAIGIRPIFNAASFVAALMSESPYNCLRAMTAATHARMASEIATRPTTAFQRPVMNDIIKLLAADNVRLTKSHVEKLLQARLKHA